MDLIIHGFYFQVILSIFYRIVVVSRALHEGFKVWLLVGEWNISKNKNGGQEVTSVMSQRKMSTLEIMRINVNVPVKEGKRILWEK